MKRIVVFCGSNLGRDESYREQAVQLGKLFAKQGIQLIYGGSKMGLMGVIADAVLENGGEVVGIIPDFLKKKEVVHNGLTELVVVKSLQERKIQMAERCDGVLTLPGGFGTLDELFEILTWTQLGKFTHPIGLLNWNGYFDHLVKQIQIMTDENFVKPDNQSLLIVDDHMEDLLLKMKSYIAPTVSKWIEQDQL